MAVSAKPIATLIAPNNIKKVQSSIAPQVPMKKNREIKTK